MASRPQRLRYVHATNYTVGRAIAALSKYGPLNSRELGEILEINPRALWHWFRNTDKIVMSRVAETYHYESTGVRKNHTLKCQLLQFSLPEMS